MTALFLFGAGASFGSGPCHPHEPPLGSCLFSALRALGGTASRLPDELARIFEKDFELGMSQFRYQYPGYATDILRDMAAYFAPFKPLDGNAYIELAQMLATRRERSILSTTNYDLLIEHAIMQSGFEVSYSAKPDVPSAMTVLKIHGRATSSPT